MRTPTTDADLYAFHAACLRGEHPPVFEDEPQCGFYRMRMIKGGPWVPVKIWCLANVEDGELTEDEIMLAVVGRDQDTLHWRRAWPRCANKPITEDAYLLLGFDRPHKALCCLQDAGHGLR